MLLLFFGFWGGRLYQDQDLGTHNVNAAIHDVFLKKRGMCFLAPLLPKSTQSGGTRVQGSLLDLLCLLKSDQDTRRLWEALSMSVALTVSLRSQVFTYVQTHQIVHSK